MNVMQEVLKNEDYLIQTRRTIHQYPEIGWEEYNTAKLIRESLDSMNIPYHTVGETGTIAILEGSEKGPVIGLRADIDALPIKEETDVPFQSKNEGVMHACGHDAHTAMLLTAAKVLSEHRNELKCTVKFIFQPAEERLTQSKCGSVDMIKSGLIDDLDTVAGNHMWPMIETGKISVDAGPRLTSIASMKIKIIGKGGHGAWPNKAIDPIYVASKVIDGLQSIVSRENDPNDTIVISICSIHGGTAFNIIDDSVEMLGTIRTFNPAIRFTLAEEIERIVANTCAAYRASYELEIDQAAPATVNDKRCSKLAEKSVLSILGEDGIAHFEKTPGGEDFAYMLEKYHGVYAFIGTGNKNKGCTYPLHSAQFYLDEDALRNGAAFLIQYTLDAQEEFAKQ